MTVTLNVHLQAAPERADALAAALAALLAPTRAEPGCVNYDLHRDPRDPSRFMLYENWADQAALDRHLATPHLRHFLAQADALLAAPMQLTSWQRVG